ncbi:hypothetical protein EC968_005409 [Mortierella alpina]|nr:hypothetical protein EC968_005409 [Mortierella alpina]
MDLLTKGIQGKIIKRGDEGYPHYTYQYGTSTYKDLGLISPEAVIYPVGDLDIQRAIAYAREKGVGIAVRTGGHHYTGASSTNGKNIQLDLSNTYTDFEWEPNTRFSQATLGVSITLSKFLAKLEEAGRFVPTGQCSYVHLGGHVQTGGYGHLIRGFGLLADCIQRIRIINADGEVQWVERGIQRDKELFFALVGGSPGNYGVVTDVTMTVYKDQDYPKSRGLHVRLDYNYDLLKRLLTVMAEQDDTEDTPADFDYSLTVVSDRLIEGRPGGIMVFAQWANLQGKDQVYDPAFFTKIKNAIGPMPPRMPHDGKLYNDIELPMSQLAAHWVFPVAREFQLPYIKRAYITESKTINKDGWATWAADRVDAIRNTPGCYGSAQFQYVGGKHSRFRLNDVKQEMALSWRDSTYCCTMDVFHEEEAVRAAKEWVARNDSEGVGHADGKFSKQDRRLLWASRDFDLEAARKYYFEDETKYGRLSATKLKVDKDFIFTANKFAVGPHPARLNIPIKGVGMEDPRAGVAVEP